MATAVQASALPAGEAEEPSRASEKAPYVDAIGSKACDKEKEDTGLKDVPTTEESSKAIEAPVKRKGGRDPITNKSPWTKEVVCVYWYSL